MFALIAGNSVNPTRSIKWFTLFSSESVEQAYTSEITQDKNEIALTILFFCAYSTYLSISVVLIMTTNGRTVLRRVSVVTK